jgi:hypothetical protein
MKIRPPAPQMRFVCNYKKNYNTFEPE